MEQRIAAASRHLTHAQVRAIKLDVRDHLLLKEMDVALLSLIDRIEAEGGVIQSDFTWELRVQCEYAVEKDE